jgi:hypothetical protein
MRSQARFSIRARLAALSSLIGRRRLRKILQYARESVTDAGRARLPFRPYAA